MDPTYGQMLATAGHVAAAWQRATADVGQRAFMTVRRETAATLRLAARPLGVPEAARGTAVEDVAWQLYLQHRRALRGLAALPTLWAAVFLNNLDAERRAGPVRDGAPGSPGTRPPV